MRVFVLGGYGKVGHAAARLLAQDETISKLAIAGRNLGRAAEVATGLSDKAVAVHVDGRDENELVGHLADYDLIINAAYDDAVLCGIRAATRAGTHYCDANVVYEEARQLAHNARTAGIHAVIANGIGPNISNLMGVHLARQLEEVEQIQRGFCDFFDYESGKELTPWQWRSDPTESLEAVKSVRSFVSWVFHTVQERGTRTVLSCEDGQWVEVNPMETLTEMPSLREGTISKYAFACLDDTWRALPHDLARAAPVDVYFSVLPGQLDAELRKEAARVRDKGTDAETAVQQFYDKVASDPGRWLVVPDSYLPVPMMWVRAIGRKGNRMARATCWLTEAAWTAGGYFLTSAALVAAANKILRGEVREQGVLTGEVAFEPLPFFEEVAALLPEPAAGGMLIGESFEWLQSAY